MRIVLPSGWLRSSGTNRSPHVASYPRGIEARHGRVTKRGRPFVGSAVGVDVAVGVGSGDGVGVGGAGVAVGETDVAVGRIGVSVAAGGVDVATGGCGVSLAACAIGLPVSGTGVIVDPAGPQPVANSPKTASSPSVLRRADMIASPVLQGDGCGSDLPPSFSIAIPLTLSSHTTRLGCWVFSNRIDQGEQLRGDRPTRHTVSKSLRSLPGSLPVTCQA